jgi:hypothetical protein
MMRLAVVLGTLLLVPLIAVAEIEKVARPCEKGICLAWWPKMVPAKGWHQESDSSFANGVNIQVPDGFTFSNAETVIYAKASYKPRIPKTTSLEMLIKDDKDEFLTRDPSISIVEVQPLKTADGKILKSYTFFPKGKGNWEQASYGEEGDFYLIFTISSRSRSGFLGSFTVYEQYIGQYKEGP